MSVYNGALRASRIATLNATGTSAGVDLEQPLAKFTMQTVVTGAPTAVSVKLQGSLDNANWFDLATSTSTTGDAQFAVDKPCQYIRANLGTLTGGTSPVVSVFACGTRG